MAVVARKKSGPGRERRRSVSELIPNDIVVQSDEFLKI